MDQGGFNLFRGFLSQFNLGVSTGYGATFYTHDLKGFGIYQPDGGTSVFIFDQAFVNRDTLPVIYSDWVNNPFGIGFNVLHHRDDLFFAKALVLHLESSPLSW